MARNHGVDEFRLTPVSPEVRREKSLENREMKRVKEAARRTRKREQGMRAQHFHMPADLFDQVKSFQKEHDLPNREAALTALLRLGFSQSRATRSNKQLTKEGHP